LKKLKLHIARWLLNYSASIAGCVVDSTLVKQVWANLIHAVKYSGKKEKPLIEIAVITRAANDISM